MAALTAAGYSAHLTREPGGAPAAEAIRALVVSSDVALSPLSEALLHYAARREHLDVTVSPALAAGQWVVSDRFSDSTMAYQGFGHGLDHHAIRQLHELVVPDIAPDLTLFFDLDVTEGLARARARSPDGDRYERLDLAFHTRVREGFLDAVRREPERCIVVPADGDEDAVADRVRAVVAERLSIVL